MREYNHPNINAIGLAVKIVQAIEDGLDRYKRGKAGDEDTKRLLGLLENPIQNFIKEISETLDEYFGTYHPDDKYFDKWLKKTDKN